jgi:NAD(P)H-dependent FMN reductase
VNVRFESADSRLLARVIHLAHRFGCTYTHLSTLRHDGIYVSVLELEGQTPSVTRLARQIEKLVAIEGETQT